jgi:hypothetical protein
VDAVGARHHRIAHPLGVGAAAARVFAVVGRRRGKLGLDIATQRPVCHHGRLHLGEERRVGVEPVEVAIEDQPLATGLLREAGQYRIERQRVAVEATHQVEHLEILQIGRRRAGERLGPVAVMQRAGSPRCIRLRWGVGGQGVHRRSQS